MSLALKEARDAAVARLGAIADIAEERTLTDEERAEAAELRSTIEDIDARWELADSVREARANGREVAEATNTDDELRASVQEPRVPMAIKERDPGHYTKEGTRSWFVDKANADLSGDQEARRRLQETSAYAHQEMRALSSASAAAGGELVPPLYLQQLFKEKREKATPVLQMVSRLPLPATGASVTVPIMDGSTAAAIQSDGGTITSTDATFTHTTANIYHVAGAQTLSLQLVERSEPGADMVILQNLGKQVAIQMAAKVLHGTGSGEPTGISATSGINAVSYSDGSPTLAELYPKVADAIQQIHTGFFAPPTDVLVAPRRWAWMLSALDSTSRPFVTPYAPMNPLADPGAVASSGVVGNLQGLPVSTDANITLLNGASTNEDIILIGDFSQAMLWVNDAPMFEVSRENRFGTGEIVIRARQYYAFSAAGYPKAFSKITGTGLTSPSF